MNVLDPIIAAKSREVDALKAAGPIDVSTAADPLPFAQTLIDARHRGRCGIIAEFKRSSPSAGDIATSAAPGCVARAYRDAGASCLSILTDPIAFDGKLDDLESARIASNLPCLRKDFMIDPIQIDQARHAGADAILLILSILDDHLAASMCDRASQLGMDVLIEVHTQGELSRALTLPSPLIGINNRDLTTLHVDLAVTERLAANVPNDRLIVAESGITSPEDIARLHRAGAGAFLIGSHLMASGDPAAALAPLVAAAASE